MKDRKVTKLQVRFDTMRALIGMDAVVEVLMKATPDVSTYATAPGREQQGKLHRHKAA